MVYILVYIFIIMDQQNNEICSNEIYSSATVFILLSHVVSMNFFFLNIFFSLRLKNLSTQFLSLIYSISESLFLGFSSSKLFPNFWLFLVLFWMLWMLATVHNVMLTLWKLQIATTCSLNSTITNIYIKHMAWHGLQASWITI